MTIDLIKSGWLSSRSNFDEIPDLNIEGKREHGNTNKY